MFKCFVCKEWIDEERGDKYWIDEESGRPAHPECLESLEGYEVFEVDRRGHVKHADLPSPRL